MSIMTIAAENMLRRPHHRFVVYPRPRTARRDQAAFKVKSILKGTEYECALSHLNAGQLFLILYVQYHARSLLDGSSSRLQNKNGQILPLRLRPLSPKTSASYHRRMFLSRLMCSLSCQLIPKSKENRSSSFSSIEVPNHSYLSACCWLIVAFSFRNRNGCTIFDTEPYANDCVGCFR